jgi:parallel beta-helix repeat protein
VSGVTVSGNTIQNSLYDGVGFSTSSNITFQSNIIQSPGRNGIVIQPPFYPAPTGSATIQANTVMGLTGSNQPYINNSAGYSATVTGNSWNHSASPKLVPGRSVSFLSGANGEYVCADLNLNPAATLQANRTSAGQWESFTVVDAGNGDIGLLAQSNSKYVCADNTGTSPLIANRTSVGQWETFTEIDAGNGNIGLLSHANSMYVCADNAGANPLIANRSAIGGWESFAVLIH